MLAKRRVRIDSEELIIYLCAAIVGAIPVAFALAQHTAFDWEATLGLLMVIAGGVGVASQLLGSRRRWPR